MFALTAVRRDRRRCRAGWRHRDRETIDLQYDLGLSRRVGDAHWLRCLALNGHVSTVPARARRRSAPAATPCFDRVHNGHHAFVRTTSPGRRGRRFSRHVGGLRGARARSTVSRTGRVHATRRGSQSTLHRLRAPQIFPCHCTSCTDGFSGSGWDRHSPMRFAHSASTPVAEQADLPNDSSGAVALRPCLGGGEHWLITADNLTLMFEGPSADAARLTTWRYSAARPSASPAGCATRITIGSTRTEVLEAFDTAVDIGDAIEVLHRWRCSSDSAVGPSLGSATLLRPRSHCCHVTSSRRRIEFINMISLSVDETCG